MANGISIDDYRWLVGSAGRHWLDTLVSDDRSLVQLTGALRAELSAERTHLLLEQLSLRKRALKKFSAAGRMFFTPVGLEQATDETVAAYKADRFPADGAVWDLCCGIGGDLLSLAGRTTATGVDRDEIAVVLAKANLAAALPEPRRYGSQVQAGSVAELDLAGAAAWHIDPDRRPTGRRTTRVELHEPNAEAIDRLLLQCEHAAIKLAPAAEVSERWARDAELEWISRGGECRQLVAWFGRLGQNPGRRRATVLAQGHAPSSVLGENDVYVPPARSLGRYLFEADAAVLAANLNGALAVELGLAPVAPNSAYLTGDQPLDHPAAAAFEITDVLPFDARRLKAIFRDRKVGRLEVKKRGVPNDPAQVQRQLQSQGDQSATLLLARIAGKVTAIIGRRL